MDITLLQPIMDNCAQQVECLIAQGFSSEYFALNYITPERLHIMLEGGGPDQILALKAILAQRIELAEHDQYLMWMVLLLLKQQGTEEDY